MPAKAAIRYSSSLCTWSCGIHSEPCFIENQCIRSFGHDNGFFLQHKYSLSNLGYMDDDWRAIDFNVLPCEMGSAFGIPSESLGYLSNYRVIHSSNGLLLLVKGSSPTIEFIVCNPTTREWATLHTPNGFEVAEIDRNPFNHDKLDNVMSPPIDVLQKMLSFNRKGDGSAKVENHNFSQELTRKELTSMVIVHEYPLSIVDYIGFKRYTSSLNPNFKLITRPTLKSDIMKMFESEKAKLRNYFEGLGGRIAITTDMWTASSQKKGYMAVTSHFIDNQWNLHNKTLRFTYVPSPHTNEVLAQILIESLEMYNIHEKLSCVVVDNCSTNDKMMQVLKYRFDSSTLLLDGAFLHLRCSAHILTLVVQDGLDVIASGIDNLRSCVSFWTASPKRMQMFEDKARILRIYCSKKLVLDCKTRWNSTYMMLETAKLYKDVFAKLKIQHPRFKFEVPSLDEWKWIESVCKKLSKFHKVTEIFSGRKYPTANLFFRKVCNIKIALMSWLCSDELKIRDMGEKMIEKFDKYWSSICGILAIAAVLDPRDKMECVEHYFKIIYGDLALVKIEKVKSLLLQLLFVYQDSAHDTQGTEYVSTSLDVLGKRYVAFVDDEDDDDADFGTAKKSKKRKANVSSELAYYLEDSPLPDSEGYDVLNYWKTDLRYPTLRKIAKDILAIPVSTVASESAFSMGGRVVSPHRSRLHKDTVEALMCMQNWIGEDYGAFMDDNDAFGTILEDNDVEDSAIQSNHKVIEADRYLDL